MYWGYFCLLALSSFLCCLDYMTINELEKRSQKHERAMLSCSLSNLDLLSVEKNLGGTCTGERKLINTCRESFVCTAFPPFSIAFDLAHAYQDENEPRVCDYRTTMTISLMCFFSVFNCLIVFTYEKQLLCGQGRDQVRHGTVRRAAHHIRQNGFPIEFTRLENEYG